MPSLAEGKESKLSYSGNLLVENRNGLIVNAEVFVASGTAERDAARVMLEQIPGGKQVTVGGDKGFDTRDFVAECRHLGVTPHVAQNLQRNGGSRSVPGCCGWSLRIRERLCRRARSVNVNQRFSRWKN